MNCGCWGQSPRPRSKSKPKESQRFETKWNLGKLILLRASRRCRKVCIVMLELNIWARRRCKTKKRREIKETLWVFVKVGCPQIHLVGVFGGGVLVCIECGWTQVGAGGWRINLEHDGFYGIIQVFGWLKVGQGLSKYSVF